MSEWKEYIINEIAEVVGGGTPKTSIDEYWGGNISWLTPRDLTSYGRTYISKGERNITQSGLSNSSARILPKGTVLLTSRAPIGYTAIAEKDLCTNQGFKSLIPKHDIVQNIFLYYWVNANVEYIKSNGSGTTFSEISGSVLKELKIKLPPLPEQKAIASVLSSLDDKIDLLHRQNKTLEAMAETLFRQWFVEEAEDDWEVGSLGMVANIDTGFAFKSKYYETDGMLRVIRGKNVTIGSLRWGADAKYWNESIEDLENYFIEKWDIVIGMDGSRIGQNRALVLESDLPAILAQRVARLKAKLDNQQPFVWRHVFSDDFKEYIVSIHTGTSIPHISQTQIADYEILIPSQEKINKFSNIVQSFWDKSERNVAQIKKLEDIRNTLLPKLMSGEVRVLNHD